MVERNSEMRFDQRFPNWEDMNVHAAPLRNARQLSHCEPEILNMLNHLIRAHEVERFIVERNPEVIAEEANPIKRTGRRLCR